MNLAHHGLISLIEYAICTLATAIYSSLPGPARPLQGAVKPPFLTVVTTVFRVTNGPMVYFNLGPITVKASSVFKWGEGERRTTAQSDKACTSGCGNLCGHKLCTRTAHVYLSLTKGVVSKKRRNSCCVYKWQLLWPEDKHSYTYASLGNSSGFICILLPVSFWHSWLHKSQTEIFYYKMYVPVKNSHSLFSFGSWVQWHLFIMFIWP